MQRLTAFSLTFFSVYLVFYILIAAQSFFVPLLIAIVIAYFVISIAEGLRKISILGWRLPRALAFLASFLLLLGIVYLVFTLVSSNVFSIIETAPVYQEKFKNLIHVFFEKIGRPLPDISRKLEEIDLTSLLTQVVLVLTDLAGRAGMIGIYVIFLLIEYHYFDKKLMALFKSDKGKESAKKIISKIASQIQSYFRIKTLLSALTAFSSYMLLVWVGVDFPGFWALLIFLLNFIPTIGSIVATIFPILLTLLQFGTLLPFFVVAVGLILIQFLIGNVLEPRIMGKQFNLSGLVIILSLTIWGQIWGIIGMLLCVPLLMITSIILANFPQTRSIAIMLSQSGTMEE